MSTDPSTQTNTKGELITEKELSEINKYIHSAHQSQQAPNIDIKGEKTENTNLEGNKNLKDNEDPLEKLMSAVEQKKKTGELPKKLFVVQKGKMANQLTEILVQSFREEGINDTDIIRLLLNLDRLTEEGTINNKFFNDLMKQA
jgi:hypothetical protein